MPANEGRSGYSRLVIKIMFVHFLFVFEIYEVKDFSCLCCCCPINTMTHFQLLCVGVTLRFILMVTTTVFVLRNAQFWYVENIERKTKIRIKKKKKSI